MRAVVYTSSGDSSVMEVVDRPLPEPGPGEVRVRLVRSGVNPTDWKFRAGGVNDRYDEVVPGHDGAGVVDEVGADVTSYAVGDRVWTVLAQHGRALGTAAEHTVQPVSRVAALPEGASFDLGAALGVPAVTAHRALTAGEDVHRLAPGWSGATVVATVSSEEKAALARAAGAQHVVDYTAGTREEVVEAVQAVAPDGVDLVVEVSLVDNVDLDLAVLRPHGTISFYADTGGSHASIPVRASFAANARLQGLILYTLREDLLRAAVDDVNDAVAAGALRVGEDAGLPLHHYPLGQTAAAHDAVQGGAVGKVLLDLPQQG